MTFPDVLSALLLALPPWVGFWIFRRKGRVGLSYGYFLGGILGILSLPWPRISGHPVPSTFLGAALFGFTFFLQAQREGAQGLRRLAVGVGGASLFGIILLVQVALPWHAIPRFWAGALIEGLLWLVLSDLAHRWTGGRLLELRMPLVGAAALGIGAFLQRWLPSDAPRLPWPAALLGGLLLGLVAVEQLRWLRQQGAWVEGRGQGLRTALALLDKGPAREARGLAYGLEARQAQWLVDEKGRVLESNGPFSRQVGMPRHRLRGYALNALFQGTEAPAWESLRSQLLQRGAGFVQATQVSEDGAFHEVRLEAVAFDRGMALVWIADPGPGTLTLRPEGRSFRPQDSEEDRRDTLNALATLIPSAELLGNVATGEARETARRILAATRRLGPDPELEPDPSILPAPVDFEALTAHLRRLLPEGTRVAFRLAPVSLRLGDEALRYLTTHLLLHAAEAARGGEIQVKLEAVELGGRLWGLLQACPSGPGARLPEHLLGLGWLQAAVVEARGMLELEQDGRGGVQPRVYLPASRPEPLPACPLEGRRIWIVERDPLFRETLAALIGQWGGTAETFEDLPALLRVSRETPLPGTLVLERTPKLDRFQKALRTFQREPLPTLVLGSGQPLPVDPARLGLQRLGFLEKPFMAREFAHALLALVRPPSA